MLPFAALWPVLIVVGLGLAIIAGHAGVVGDLLATVGGRGARVGTATSPNALRVIEDDPQRLADSAALDLDTYALARLISSEEGNSPAVEKLAVGWAAWNAHGPAIAAALLAGKGDADDHFKDQGYAYSTGPTSTARAAGYASTALDPHEDDVKLAQAIIAGTAPDPTGGATNFFRPRLEDKLYAAGKVSRDGAAVIAEWTAGGLRPVDVPGIDPSELAFFRKVA
jgi:hypothetical protein